MLSETCVVTPPNPAALIPVIFRFVKESSITRRIRGACSKIIRSSIPTNAVSSIVTHPCSQAVASNSFSTTVLPTPRVPTKNNARAGAPGPAFNASLKSLYHFIPPHRNSRSETKCWRKWVGCFHNSIPTSVVQLVQYRSVIQLVQFLGVVQLVQYCTPFCKNPVPRNLWRRREFASRNLRIAAHYRGTVLWRKNFIHMDLRAALIKK